MGKTVVLHRGLNYVVTSRPKQFVRALERLYKKYALNSDWGFNFDVEE